MTESEIAAKQSRASKLLCAGALVLFTATAFLIAAFATSDWAGIGSVTYIVGAIGLVIIFIGIHFDNQVKGLQYANLEKELSSEAHESNLGT